MNIQELRNPPSLGYRLLLAPAVVALLSTSLLSCSTTPRSSTRALQKTSVQDAQTSVHQERDLTRLFPNGQYRHEVALAIELSGGSSSGAPKKLNFSGVVQLSEPQIQVVVLSAFGTTAFRITEDLTSGRGKAENPVKIEIYIEPMKKLEPRLRQYYQVLREVLLAPAQKQFAARRANHIEWVSQNEAGFPEEMKTQGFEENATFRFSAFDAQKIPLHFSIAHPKFQAEVEVSSYEI